MRWSMLVCCLFVIVALASPKCSYGGTGHNVVLTWTDSDPVTFNMYRGTTAGVCKKAPPLNTQPITLKTYTDSSVTAGATYFYAVSAVDSAGVEGTSCSNEVQAIVPPPPAPPTNLQAVTN